jgi:hypothetical protein
MDRLRSDSGREPPHHAKDTLKAQISFPDVLAYYGVTLDSGGRGRCPFPQNHKNRDANPSLQYDQRTERAYCNSARCLDVDGARGADMIGFVQHMERIDYGDAVKWLQRFSGKPGDLPLGQPRSTSKPPQDESASGGVYSYVYQNRMGDDVYTIKRIEDANKKRFVMIPKGVKPEDRVLYRLPEMFDGEDPVVIVEGEKCVDVLRKIDINATTAPLGAGKWQKHYGQNLKGRKVVIWPDKDEPGQHHGDSVYMAIRGLAGEIRRVDAPEWLTDGGDVADVLSDCEHGGEQVVRDLIDEASLYKCSPKESLIPELVCIASIMPQQVDWIWKPYFPLGHCTDLSGDPGVGKSQVALSIACQLSRGYPVSSEEDQTIAGPVNSVILTAEDHVASTVRPRLESMGADLKRIAVISSPFGFGKETLRALEEQIIEWNARLLVIDPIVAYLHKTDMYRANEVREVMALLSDIAERCRCSVIIIRHLNKSVGNKGVYRTGGSIDFTAAVRSALLVGHPPDDEDRRAIIHIKSNLGPVGPSLGYSVADGTFQWTGKSDLTQADILSHGSERVENKSELEDMIREWLSGGEKPVTEINELAEGLGFSPKAVYTARKKLCDKPRRVGGTGTKGHWVTKLKEQCVITNTCGKG